MIRFSYACDGRTGDSLAIVNSLRPRVSGASIAITQCAYLRRPEVACGYRAAEISWNCISRATRYTRTVWMRRAESRDNPARYSTGTRVTAKVLTIGITVKGINSPLSFVRPCRAVPWIPILAPFLALPRARRCTMFIVQN